MFIELNFDVLDNEHLIIIILMFYDQIESEIFHVIELNQTNMIVES